MTGCEIFAKQGSKFYLVKVRHDGYDFIDEFFPRNLINWKEGPVAYLTKYLNTRSKGSSELTETKKRLVFEFKPDLEGKYGFRAFEKANNQYSGIINKDPALKKEFDGYTCSYADYQFFLDFDEQKAYDTSDKSIIQNKEE